MIHIKLNIVKLSENNSFGKNDIYIEMATLYKNGNFVKHLPIDKHLQNLIGKEFISISDEKYKQYERDISEFNYV